MNEDPTEPIDAAHAAPIAPPPIPTGAPTLTPVPPPAPVIPPKPTASFEVREIGKPDPWRLSLYPDRLRLDPPVGFLPIELTPADEPAKFELHDNPFMRRTLVLRRDGKNVIFKLDPEPHRAVTAWVGPPTRAKLVAALAQRFSWIVPLGAIALVTSALALLAPPRPNDPIAPWHEVLWAAIGVVMVVGGLWARARPHPAFFLVHAVAFALLAVDAAARVAAGRGNWLVLLLIFQLLMVASSVAQYRKFARVTDPAAPQPAA